MVLNKPITYVLFLGEHCLWMFLNHSILSVQALLREPGKECCCSVFAVCSLALDLQQHQASKEKAVMSQRRLERQRQRECVKEGGVNQKAIILLKITLGKNPNIQLQQGYCAQLGNPTISLFYSLTCLQTSLMHKDTHSLIKQEADVQRSANESLFNMEAQVITPDHSELFMIVRLAEARRQPKTINRKSSSNRETEHERYQ